MVDKILARVEATQKNWWTHLKKSVNISNNYKYYEFHPNLKYRYPAPGSCEMTAHDRPHMFKKHWKTPFRYSQYNIRQIEKVKTLEDRSEHWISSLPDLDPNNPADAELLLSYQPKIDDLKIAKEADAPAFGSEEANAELWAAFEELPKRQEELIQETSGYQGDLGARYNQKELQHYEREWSGLDADPISRNVMVELEYMIEKEFGAKHIKEGKVNMYKGTVKKWQVLDDAEHEPDQIEKLQASIQAPLPAELEMYKEKHDRPMQLPFNDENARLWRDEPKAVDSADFDPDFLAIDRERSKKFFIERYEQPKQLQ